MILDHAVLIADYEHIPHKQVNGNYEYLFNITVLRFANNAIVHASTLGTAIGATENEIARCESGISAVGVQFPLPEALPENRPQLRPKITRTFKNYEAGKSIAGYK
uniref:Uncharacterized protein n=1 Tax=Panagrolaimus davidi TaxID=227884 RepID=A0A914P7J7_9BILA